MTIYFVDLPPSQFALSAAAPDPGGTGILTQGGKFGIQAYAEGEGVYGKSTSWAGGAGIIGVHDNPSAEQDSYGVHGLKLGGPGAAVYGEASALSYGVLARASSTAVRAESQRGSAISAVNEGNVPTISVLNNNKNPGDYSEAISAEKKIGRGSVISAKHHGLRPEAQVGEAAVSAEHFGPYGFAVSAQSWDPKGVGIYAFGKRFAGLFEGNVHVTGTLTHGKGADCAEDFDVAEDAGVVEPGTVMVLDDDGALRPSTSPFDARVVGVVSGGGQYRPAIVLDRRDGDAGNRLPIALLGKVSCQVDASLGPIGVGDPLTTSATPGHAMSARSEAGSAGTILGKALEPLESGKGLIAVLVGLR
ncbi:MAG TPA: hypothetical protein VJS15_04225 [Allosphingosinicella sp.]|nr:hypothetical protein [Allosphingosinicella sp.]